MVTIKDIAQRCNVSIATVSNILNGKSNVGKETRKRVLQVVKELNYTPNSVAKNLKMKRSRAIGVIAEDMTVFCTPEIIDGITKCCEEEGYYILLTNLRLYKKYSDTYYETEDFTDIVEKDIRELLSKQVDGIVYVTAHERKIKCFPEDLEIPACIAYGYSVSERFPSIVVDDKNGAYMIVKYLTENGHHSIGVITGKENSIHTSDRLIGYQKALFESKICYNPELVVTGDWKRQSGYENTDSLLAHGVTAIFCMNDVMAGGVYDRLEERGLIPGKDISVVGFDNRELSNFYHPPLTTTGLPLFEIGYTACKKIVDMLEKKSRENIKQEGETTKIYEQCKLLVRSSVKKEKD